MKPVTLAMLGMLALSLNACSKSGTAASTTASSTTAPSSTAASNTPAVTTTESKSTPMTQEASVRQQVQVSAGGGKVIVNTTVENGTAAPVFVPKAVFASDRIFRREFEITNQATGAEVDYTGPMVKRGPFTRDDYVAVAPGAKLAHSIDITSSYDFKPGVTYELKYAGAWLGDVAKLDAASAATVAPVTFTVNAK